MTAAPAILDDDTVTVPEAALAFKVSQKTVRQWLREGAPCVRQGKPGPGNGALVSRSDLRQWLSRRAGLDGDDGRLLERLGEAFLDTVKRDAGSGQPAHVARLVAANDAAALYLAACARIYRAETGKELTGIPSSDLPESIRQLFRIAETEPECAVAVKSELWTN